MQEPTPLSTWEFACAPPSKSSLVVAATPLRRRDPEFVARVAPGGWLDEIGKVTAPPVFCAFERPRCRQRHFPKLLPQFHRRRRTFVRLFLEAAHDDLLETLRNGTLRHV